MGSSLIWPDLKGAALRPQLEEVNVASLKLGACEAPVGVPYLG